MDLVEPKVPVKDGWHFDFQPFISSKICPFTAMSGMSLSLGAELPA